MSPVSAVTTWNPCFVAQCPSRRSSTDISTSWICVPNFVYHSWRYFSWCLSTLSSFKNLCWFSRKISTPRQDGAPQHLFKHVKISTAASINSRSHMNCSSKYMINEESEFFDVKTGCYKADNFWLRGRGCRVIPDGLFCLTSPMHDTVITPEWPNTPITLT